MQSQNLVQYLIYKNCPISEEWIKISNKTVWATSLSPSQINPHIHSTPSLPLCLWLMASVSPYILIIHASLDIFTPIIHPPIHPPICSILSFLLVSFINYSLHFFIRSIIYLFHLFLHCIIAFIYECHLLDRFLCQRDLFLGTTARPFP